MKLIIGLIVLGLFWWSWKKKGAVGLVAAIIVFFVVDEWILTPVRRGLEGRAQSEHQALEQKAELERKNESALDGWLPFSFFRAGAGRGEPRSGNEPRLPVHPITRV